MKNIVNILLILFVFTFIAKAEPNSDDVDAKNKTERYIHFVYDKLSFKKMQKLNFEAFSKGFYGYLNLKEAGKVSGNALLTICDFSLSSNLKRLWVIDVNKKKILFNTLVAHGMGSGEEFATKFSNTPDSHQSSLGFYTTGETYMGDNGYSLKLNGVDGIFNNNAFDRSIVIHGADYVCNSFACANNRIGRSHGCPALPREFSEAIIDKIQDGSVLFIYHPTKAYIKNSYWLTNKINHLPSEADYIDILQPKTNNPRWVDASAAKDSSIALHNRIIPLNNALPVIKDSIKKNIKSISITTTSSNINNTTPTTPPRDKEFLYMK